MISAAVKELQSAKKEIASQIQGLQAEASKIDNAIRALGGSSVGGAVAAKGSYTRTAAQRKAQSNAQKARWAKIRAGKASAGKPAKKKRTMSAAAKAKLSAFQKARWAKIRAAKKK